MTHICVGNLNIIGPDNGLSLGRRQAIIWTNAGILLFGPLRTNANEIFEIYTFSSKIWECRLENSGNFCLGLNVLRTVHDMSLWAMIRLSHFYFNSVCCIAIYLTGLLWGPSVLGTFPIFHKLNITFITVMLIGMDGSTMLWKLCPFVQMVVRCLGSSRPLLVLMKAHEWWIGLTHPNRLGWLLRTKIVLFTAWRG